MMKQHAEVHGFRIPAKHPETVVGEAPYRSLGNNSLMGRDIEKCNAAKQEFHFPTSGSLKLIEDVDCYVTPCTCYATTSNHFNFREAP